MSYWLFIIQRIQNCAQFHVHLLVLSAVVCRYLCANKVVCRPGSGFHRTVILHNKHCNKTRLNSIDYIRISLRLCVPFHSQYSAEIYPTLWTEIVLGRGRRGGDAKIKRTDINQMVVRCLLCKETQREQCMCVCPVRMQDKIIGFK